MFTDKNNFSPRLGLAFRPFGDANYCDSRRLRTVLSVLARFACAERHWRSMAIDRIVHPRKREHSLDPVPHAFCSHFCLCRRADDQWTERAVPERAHPSVESFRRTPDSWNGRRHRLCRNSVAEYSVQRRSQFSAAQHAFRSARRAAPILIQHRQPVQTGGSATYHGLRPKPTAVCPAAYGSTSTTRRQRSHRYSARSYTAGIQQNQYARYLERADDPALRRQQLRFSYVFDIPFGRGKHFGTDMSRPLDFM